MHIETNSPHFQNIYLFIVANAGLIVASVQIIEADSWHIAANLCN